MIFAQTTQLDFLLSRAKEYSEFIANDIDELQSEMQAKAAAEALGGGGSGKKKGSKKRASSSASAGSGGKKKKRGKKNNGEPTDGEVNLQSAQDKYAALEKKPIFIQPKNLSNNCVLKDYQLEGTRWLVSLYENGVRNQDDMKCIHTYLFLYTYLTLLFFLNLSITG